MKGKFYLASVRPRIDILGNIAYAQHDLLFDWHRFEIPNGGACLKSLNIIDPGKDGAATTGIDFEFFIAKSVNGAAPPSLGTVNSAANGAATKIGMAGSRNHMVYHRAVDASAMENIDTYTQSYNIWTQTTANTTGTTNTAQINNALQPGGVMIGSGDHFGGTTKGYQSLWIAAITNGAHDWGTAVLLDQAGNQAAVAKSTTSETTLTVSGTDADDVFSVGDELISFVESDGSSPAKIGKVTKITSATSINVDHVEEAFNDDTEICFRGPLTFNLGFEY